MSDRGKMSRPSAKGTGWQASTRLRQRGRPAATRKGRGCPPAREITEEGKRQAAWQAGGGYCQKGKATIYLTYLHVL